MKRSELKQIIREVIEESVQASNPPMINSILAGDAVVHIPNKKIAIVIDVFPEEDVFRIDTDGIVDAEEVRLATVKDMDNMSLELANSTIRRLKAIPAHAKLMKNIEPRLNK